MMKSRGGAALREAAMCTPAPRFRFEGFEFDLTRRRVSGPTGDIEFRPKSFELLCYLVENPGRLIAKDEIRENSEPGSADIPVLKQGDGRWPSR
jgi:DNA-binding response OmpR family regulator